MGNIIQKYDGVVFEYIGDAMMIVFGAPKDVDNHQRKAVQCALEMRTHLETLNKKWEEEDIAQFWQNQEIETLTARVGIHQRPSMAQRLQMPFVNQAFTVEDISIRVCDFIV